MISLAPMIPSNKRCWDKVFSEMPRRGEEYSLEIKKEILRGEINERFMRGAKINKQYLKSSRGGDWPLIISALKEWEAQKFLRILKNPQEIVDDQEICVESA